MYPTVLIFVFHNNRLQLYQNCISASSFVNPCRMPEKNAEVVLFRAGTLLG